ncbi:MAG: 4-amino-4-deoxy-L-arabinose-phosphoundecaprenol flippase subunit ArnF [Candidatus Arsenophonus melophagi]|nr:4-amino-4-deoxy-L-arabinose-phosphoundecaprenol flippase subunit ArnF [Candidatus Arsenophonus melophagi]
MNGYFLGIGSVIATTCAQLFLKAGVALLPKFKFTYQWDYRWFFKNHLAFELICIGFIGYAISMVFWLYTLRCLALSKAYSLISLTYVLVYVLSVTLPWFHESVTLVRCLGIVFIFFGILTVSYSERNQVRK